MRLFIIDTGSANLNSVKQAFKRIGADALISSDVTELKTADKLVLPGVGTACAVMEGIDKYNLASFILENKKPLLGICLGMQILGTHSEETPLGSDENDVIKCLSIIDGSVHKMKGDNSLRMPHMGWNTVNHTDHPLFDGIKQDAYFYFDHSFAMNEGSFTIGKTTYGETFSCAVAKDNFMGVQFHPEKSSHAGSRLLENFVKNF